LLQNAHVPSGRFVVNSDLSAKLGEIGRLPGMVRKNLEQSWQLVGLLDLSYVSHVTLHDGLYVIACPGLATPGILPSQHLGIAANQDGMYEIVANHSFTRFGRFARERNFQKGRPFALDLGS
jgi:hypothetical protein